MNKLYPPVIHAFNMSTYELEIINPYIEPSIYTHMDGCNLMQCNKSRNVAKHIKTGNNYVFELPNSNTILNVTCTFAGINACDMKIKSITKCGIKKMTDNGCTISYVYANFDNIHYSSFSYVEPCLLYTSINNLLA
jgi:hypothetical protein